MRSAALAACSQAKLSSRVLSLAPAFATLELECQLLADFCPSEGLLLALSGQVFLHPRGRSRQAELVFTKRVPVAFAANFLSLLQPPILS